jgi:hypothetical protein
VLLECEEIAAVPASGRPTVVGAESDAADVRGAAVAVVEHTHTLAEHVECQARSGVCSPIRKKQPPAYSAGGLVGG